MPTIVHPVITKTKPTARGRIPCPDFEAATPFRRANDKIGVS